MNRIIAFFLVALIAVCSISCNSKSDSDYFDFPEGFTPGEVGEKLSSRFISSKHLFYDRYIHYAEVFTWFGALRFSAITENDALVSQLQERFELLINSEREYLPPMNHGDYNMFGCLPLEFHMIKNNQQYFDLGMLYADTQWTLPEGADHQQKALAEKGLSWQTRMWIDDMYVYTILQAQAYRATGKQEYIDRTAREMIVYLDSLQRPNGLFFHAPDAPFFWGRGNGWMAAGMAELLRWLPENNPDRPTILKGYLKMMESLRSFQSESGMWNQLIDDPDCWPETSSTAMFTYSMICGIKQGWLPAAEYVPVVRKAWMALVSYIDENGDVAEVCEGTVTMNDRQFYYDRPRILGDYHGQAPVLWCTYALLEDIDKPSKTGKK